MYFFNALSFVLLWITVNCQEQVESSGSEGCENDPCKNGGTCTGENETLCNCASGYSGTFCENEPASGSDAWIAGVVIGIAVVLAIIAFFLWRMRSVKHTTRRKTARRLSDQSNTSSSSNEPMPMHGSEPIYENRAFDPNACDHKITLDQLLKTYHDLAANKNQLADRQFKTDLKETAKLVASEGSVAKNATNRPKNRFTNIFPFDFNRVKLKSSQNDYTNASFIEGYYSSKKFIASQGPMVDTVNDFWLMIWEQNTRLIVMLTNPVEQGKRKCEQYWPDGSGEKAYGTVRVVSLRQTTFAGYCVRKFRVTCDDNFTEPAREITQFHLVTWPDHGVPVSTTAFLRLHKIVDRRQKECDVVSPVVVHCSAGVGRTGTFIGFDHLKNEMREKSSVDIFQCVLNLRKQRPEMVQSQAQYVFLHKLLAEIYVLGDTDFDASACQSQLTKLTANGSNGRSGFQTEFEKLNEVAPPNFQGVSTFVNKSSVDRSQLILPPLEGNHEQVEYDASEIPMTGMEKLVIAAKAPTATTATEFWHAVWHKDTCTIIQLTSKNNLFNYWPESKEKSVKYGEISVRLMKHVEQQQGVSEKQIQLDYNSLQTEVVLLQFTNWEDDGFPEPGNVFHLISMLHQRLHADGSVMVMCSDGRGKTGTFLALMEILERAKTEGKVDVLRTVKDLRDQRHRMVASPEQYKFLHEAVSSYMEDSAIYENFSPLIQIDP